MSLQVAFLERIRPGIVLTSGSTGSNLSSLDVGESEEVVVAVGSNL
jgi:hypothetical protein